MAVEVLLPKLGLTMREGTITEWLVPAGGLVRPGDVIMRLATDKVDADVEAEGEGLFHPVVAAGATLPPGALVGWLLAAGEVPPGGPRPRPAPAERRFASPNARRVAREHGLDLATVQGTGPGGRIVSEDIEAAADRAATVATAATARPAVPSIPSVAIPSVAIPPTATPPPPAPLVRRHAETLGVDLATVAGTGAGGRIRRADVDLAAAADTRDRALPPPPARRSPPRPRPGQVVALTGMRGAIARTMRASLQEMAQLTHGYEADVTDLVALRAQLKREWTGLGGAGAAAGSTPRVPSLNDFVIRAAALALRDHPMLNATIRD
ncbi:E3 binding domain-containing protein, partial [Frankia sp. CiP3]|uniref:E3 binding domain-containing protein n=2 Tax=unclassified Frankia TaxID=2632575 RepID=UPI001EF5F96B